MPLDPSVLGELRDVVGDAHVLTEPDMVAGYVVDWTGRFRGTATAVVRPGTTAEVAAVVAACRRHGLALVPQGGNTGLVGGGVPLSGEVVLSLRRLDSLAPVAPDVGQVTAGAGATLAAVQHAAAGAGWRYGVDLAARDSATVGGTVATNAGGVRVVRHGSTRAQLLGVEAVLGTGAVVSHLGGLVKDNTGYDLAGLLCGSEGTLGVVTAARLALVPPASERVVALLGFAAAGPAIRAAAQLRRALATLEAAELFLADGLALVCEATGASTPFTSSHAAYLLVEAADVVDPTDRLAEALDSLDGVADVAVAVDSVRAAELWRYREAHTEAINTLGPPHKLDVAVPEDRLEELVAEVPAVVAGADPSARVWMFGHAGDGNVHVNVTGPTPDDERADDAVLQLVARLGGSVSAEHGIGTAKRRWLALSRSPAEIEAFRAIRRALDPDGVLNPNVLVPA